MGEKLRQVELYDAATRSRMLCWLPVDARLKRNVRLTLRGMPERIWMVMRVFSTEIEDAAMNRRWRVGGLV